MTKVARIGGRCRTSGFSGWSACGVSSEWLLVLDIDQLDKDQAGKQGPLFPGMTFIAFQTSSLFFQS